MSIFRLECQQAKDRHCQSVIKNVNRQHKGIVNLSFCQHATHRHCQSDMEYAVTILTDTLVALTADTPQHALTLTACRHGVVLLGDELVTVNVMNLKRLVNVNTVVANNVNTSTQHSA